MQLSEFNTAPVTQARDLLAVCADVPGWIEGVLAGRPFDTVDQLAGRALTLAEQWTPDDVAGALALHPRIGASSDGDGAETEFSAEEQAGVQSDHADAWLEANRRYEQKFDQIFLIRAAGRTSEEMLAALEERLENDPRTEETVRATQLRQIMVLRLQKSVTEATTATTEDTSAAGAATAPESTQQTRGERSFVTTHVLDTAHGEPARGVLIEMFDPNGGRVATGITDDDGRITTFGPAALPGGTYRIVFHVGAYWAGRSTSSFFPVVDLSFELDPQQGHYHLPLLISPYSISSYRGS